MYTADNEIDGSTLLGLTENMISRLLPTMKQQVMFIGLLMSLKTSRELSATPTTSGENSEVLFSSCSSPSRQVMYA